MSECVLVYLNPYLRYRDTIDHGDEICDQGIADLHYDGINVEVKKLKEAQC